MRVPHKVFSFCLASFLALGLFALPAQAQSTSGEGSDFSAKGVITAPVPVSVFAPMGGQAGDFSWQPGDRAEAGGLAFDILPALVYAPADGVVAGLRAQAGDTAESVMAQYGALCYINRENIWHIEALITSTSDKEETRDVQVGQTLKIQHGTADNKVQGEAAVIARDGKRFVLELEQGDFELEDDINIYLGSSKENYRADQIGSGKIIRPAALAAAGQGMIASVLVQEGERVMRGQPLFMLDSAGARYASGEEVKPEARFEPSGIISEVLARPGQYLQQGQAVMTMLPQTALEAALEVDELDIAKVRIGDTLRVSVDAYEGERKGTVTRIEPLGRVMLDTTKFIVKISFDEASDLLIGMHVRAYWD